MAARSRPTRGRPSERGTVILVALMVLTALGALALLGARLARNEVQTARNHRMNQLVMSVADSASQLAVGYASGDPVGFSALVASMSFANQPVTLTELADVAPYAWDSNPGGSLGWLGGALGPPGLAIQSDLSATLELPTFGGSSAGEFCARLTTWRISGSVGAPPMGGHEGLAESPMFGTRTVLVTSKLGPFPCAQ